MTERTHTAFAQSSGMSHEELARSNLRATLGVVLIIVLIVGLVVGLVTFGIRLSRR